MGLTTWLLSTDLGREQLALLAFCMLAAYVVAANLVWRMVRARPSPASGRSSRWRWIGAWIAQGVRSLYYVGVPVAVIGRGALIEQMGLPTTWTESSGNPIWDLLGAGEEVFIRRLGMAAALWMGGVCVFVAVWVWYGRLGIERGEWQAVPWWKALREAIFLQIVWAFYRAVISMHTSDSLYVPFVGLALVAISWLFNPFRRIDSSDISRTYAVVRDWTLALLTAFAATSVRSLWLLVVMHGMWLGVSDRVLKGVEPSRT